MSVKTIRVLWDGSNVIRKKVFYEWCMDDNINKSFKKWCSMRTGKDAIKKASLDFIDDAKSEIKIMNVEVEFLDAYVIGDMLYIDIETEEANISNILSYRCYSNLWFEEVSFQNLQSM